jgi:hypothetical protein
MTHEIDEKLRDDQSPAHVPGVCVTRRSLMNKLVVIPVAGAALPVLLPARATEAAPSLAARSTPANNLADSVRCHPDSELLDLATQFIAADMRYRELCDIVDDMESSFKNPREPLPEVLRWRKSDIKLGLPNILVNMGHANKDWHKDLQIEKIRTNKWIIWNREIIKGHPIKGMYQDRIRVVTPSKAARARADEIIAAYDEWAKDGVPPLGYKKAMREREEADEIAATLENKLTQTRASTIDGMLAKIRCAHARMEEKYDLDELEALDLGQISGCADAIAVSIFRDLQRLALTRSRSI